MDSEGYYTADHSSVAVKPPLIHSCASMGRLQSSLGCHGQVLSHKHCAVVTLAPSPLLIPPSLFWSFWGWKRMIFGIRILFQDNVLGIDYWMRLALRWVNVRTEAVLWVGMPFLMSRTISWLSFLTSDRRRWVSLLWALAGAHKYFNIWMWQFCSKLIPL